MILGPVVIARMNAATKNSHKRRASSIGKLYERLISRDNSKVTQRLFAAWFCGLSMIHARQN
jgi:hypothetical protein